MFRCPGCPCNAASVDRTLQDRRQVVLFREDKEIVISMSQLNPTWLEPYMKEFYKSCTSLCSMREYLMSVVCVLG